jgi:hypothetical protein
MGKSAKNKTVVRKSDKLKNAKLKKNKKQYYKAGWTRQAR